MEPVVLNNGIKIVYGRLEEIREMETEFMTLYLAWNTRTLLIGDRFGNKVPFSASDYSSEEIDKIVKDLQIEFDELKKSVIDYALQINETIKKEIDEITEETIERLMKEITEKIESEENPFDLFRNQDVPELKNSIIEETVRNIEKSPILDRFLTKEEFNPEDFEFVNKHLTDGEMSFSRQMKTFFVDKISTSEIRTDTIHLNGERLELWKYITEVNGVTVKDKENGNHITLKLSDLEEDEENKALINAIIPDDKKRVNAKTAGVYETGEGSITIGYNSLALGRNSVALGYQAQTTKDDAIQLGEGENNRPGTLQFKDYTVVDSDGLIPEERIVDRYYEVSTFIRWNEGDSPRRIIPLEGMTRDAIVWFSYDPSHEDSREEFMRRGVRAIDQMEDQLIVTVDSIPSIPVKVNIVWRVPRKKKGDEI